MKERKFRYLILKDIPRNFSQQKKVYVTEGKFLAKHFYDFEKYSRIPHLRKCILRKRDTEMFKKILIYKKNVESK